MGNPLCQTNLQAGFNKTLNCSSVCQFLVQTARVYYPSDSVIMMLQLRSHQTRPAVQAVGLSLRACAVPSLPEHILRPLAPVSCAETQT